MFDSRLTVQDVRLSLESITGGEQFLSFLNQSMERLINSGKYKGIKVKTRFASSTGFITLPPNYLSVLGMTYRSCPVPVFGEWHEYVESGPGIIDDAECWGGILQDMGDGFCSQLDIDPDSQGVLRIYSASADDGKLVRIFGKDVNGDAIFDATGVEGEEVTLAFPYVATTNTYSVFNGFQKPRTKSNVRVKVNGVTEYQIASYLPSETRPRYRRYKTGTTEEAIEVLCQRRYFPVSAETDWVTPGNLGAHKNMIIALKNESENQGDLYLQFKATALSLLDDEARASRGGARVDNPNQPWGWGDRNVSTH